MALVWFTTVLSLGAICICFLTATVKAECLIPSCGPALYADASADCQSRSDRIFSDTDVPRFQLEYLNITRRLNSVWLKGGEGDNCFVTVCTDGCSNQQQSCSQNHNYICVKDGNNCNRDCPTSTLQPTQARTTASPSRGPPTKATSRRTTTTRRHSATSGGKKSDLLMTSMLLTLYVGIMIM